MHTTVLMIAAIVALWITFKGMREGWQKFSKANFRGGDISYEEVGDRQTCTNKCNDLDTCAAYTMTRSKKDGKFKCWLKNASVITGNNRIDDQSKTTWIKDDHYKANKTDLGKNSVDALGRACTGKVTVYEGDYWNQNDESQESEQFGCSSTPHLTTVDITSVKIPANLAAQFMTEDESEKSGWKYGDIANVGGFWNDRIDKIMVATKTFAARNPVLNPKE